MKILTGAVHMKTFCSITVAFVVALSTCNVVLADNHPTYDSLEQFCLATNADTPENCACGQAKADILLTPEEQQLVLGLMTENPDALGQVMQMEDHGLALMEKAEPIFKGCD